MQAASKSRDVRRQAWALDAARGVASGKEMRTPSPEPLFIRFKSFALFGKESGVPPGGRRDPALYNPLPRL